MEDNFDAFIRESFTVIKNGIKSSNGLPSTEDISYYMCFPTFKKIQNKEIGKIITLMQDIIEKTGVAGNIRQRDIEEKFDLLMESNDIFLDRAGYFMDLEGGIHRNPSVELIVMKTQVLNFNRSQNNAASYHNKQILSINSGESIKLLAGKNIQRPQLLFKDKIDNSPKPWKPQIKDKPNSLKPLQLYVEYKENQSCFSHPYQFELDKFEPLKSQLIKNSPLKYKSLNDTPLIIVEKVEALKNMLKDLENLTEIAVDLEHHSYRSFQGITCLMQISTRDTDYLIDTLVLRSELYVLNEIFTKPSILKVFHGADSDILWLQRDLSLYVVNMFDTHQAAKLLELPFLSLSYLLKTYCMTDPSKHFQLADWRIRPLPKELINYARVDTHYLLYIKDILTNSLIDSDNGEKNILKAVYIHSNAICKSTYKIPIWTEDSYLNMYRKSKKLFNNRQLYALKALHKWRDETARIEDDSTSYVLPNHMLLNIAETLPREMQGVLACCNPIPPLVRQNLLKIHKMVLKARDQSLTKSALEDNIKQRYKTQRNQVLGSKTWIFAPHDIPSGMEVRANLSCLLNSSSKELLSKNQIKLKPTISVFDNSFKDKNIDLKGDTIKNKFKLLFVSPFERYKQIISMGIEQEKETAKDEHEKHEKEKLLTQNQEDNASCVNRVHEQFTKIIQSSIHTTCIDSANNQPIKITNNKSRETATITLDRNLSTEITSNGSNPRVQTLDHLYGRKRKRNLNSDIQTSHNASSQKTHTRENKNKRKN